MGWGYKQGLILLFDLGRLRTQTSVSNMAAYDPYPPSAQPDSAQLYMLKDVFD